MTLEVSREGMATSGRGMYLVPGDDGKFWLKAKSSTCSVLC